MCFNAHHEVYFEQANYSYSQPLCKKVVRHFNGASRDTDWSLNTDMLSLLCTIFNKSTSEAILSLGFEYAVQQTVRYLAGEHKILAGAPKQIIKLTLFWTPGAMFVLQEVKRGSLIQTTSEEEHNKFVKVMNELGDSEKLSLRPFLNNSCRWPCVQTSAYENSEKRLNMYSTFSTLHVSNVYQSQDCPEDEKSPAPF